MNLPTITKHFGVFVGQDIFVVGAGPSLCGFDFSRLDGKVTIALNDMVHRFVPTYHLFSDTDIWPRYQDFGYMPITHVVCQKDPAAHLWSYPHFCAKDRLLTFTQRGPDVDPINDELWCDYTVATAGIMLAWKLGAQRVYLLGVDAYRYNAIDYCWERTEEPLDEQIVIEHRDACYGDDMMKLLAYFTSFGVGPPGGVFNLSEKSTIKAWPKKTMEEVL